MKKSSAKSRKPTTNKLIVFYYGFRLFARSEAILFCIYSGLSVAGVILFSLFVADASGGNAIVATNAVLRGGVSITVRPKGDIGKPPRGRRPTGKRRTAVGMV